MKESKPETKFQKYADIGLLKSLLPIIPPDGILSPISGLDQAHLGKIPGKIISTELDENDNIVNLWAGFSKWTEHETTETDLLNWESWGCGVGLQSKCYPGIDIDVDNPELVDEIQEIIEQKLGPTAIRGRDDGSPRKVLIYKLKDGEEPLRKDRVVFEDNRGMVEFLGNGQHYVIEGKHPKGGSYTNTLPTTEITEVYAVEIENVIKAIKANFGTVAQGSSKPLPPTRTLKTKASRVYSETGGRSVETMKRVIKRWEPDTGRWDAIRDCIWGGVKDRGKKFGVLDAEAFMSLVPERKRDDTWDRYYNEIPNLVRGAVEKVKGVKERRDLPEPKLTNSKPINKKHFPETMWNAAQEVADWTGTQAINPPILAAVGTIASLLGKNVQIHEIDGDLVHPCSMGIIVGENTGTRKTEIYKKMGAPYFQYERDIQTQWDDESAERKVTADLLKNELRKRTKASPRGGNRSFSDITATAKEIANLQENLDKLQRSKPCLIVEDITEEKLVRVLDTQNCSISIFSDDARNMIRNVSGMRKQDGSGENLYLKGFTNGDYVYSRVGADGKFDDLYLRDICLNMFAFVQPDMVSKLIGTSDISSSGMAARLFIYIQEIDVDYMLEHADRRPLNKEIMAPYYESIAHLCQKPEHSVKITLSKEAGEYWVLFNKRIAALLRGEWEGEYELVNKIVTLSTKMAAVFLAMKTKDLYSHSEIEIDLDTYKSACEFVEFLGGQTISVYKMLDQSIADRGARTVSSNLQNRYEKDGEIHEFKLNARFWNTQSKPLRGKEIMSEILDILQEYGHVTKNGDLYTYVPKMEDT